VKRGYNRHTWKLEFLNSENAINASPQFKPLVIHFYPLPNVSVPLNNAYQTHTTIPTPKRDEKVTVYPFMQIFKSSQKIV
jgi:hypothetical protein